MKANQFSERSLMFTIGKLADFSDTTTDTIRFYEREGLLKPAGRNDSRYRLYDHDAVTRLRFIRHAQACGFTLAEVRDLLALRQREGACCGDVGPMHLKNSVIERFDQSCKPCRQYSNDLLWVAFRRKTQFLPVQY